MSSMTLTRVSTRLINPYKRILIAVKSSIVLSLGKTVVFLLLKAKTSLPLIAMILPNGF